MYQLSVRKEAESDLREAYSYYESCRKNLGSDLLLCVEAIFERIKRNPNQYRILFKNIRRVTVQRFPYCIYYVIQNNSVVVLAVLHARKNPISWQERT